MKLKDYLMMALFRTMESEKLTFPCRKGKISFVNLHVTFRVSALLEKKKTISFDKGHVLETPVKNS